MMDLGSIFLNSFHHGHEVRAAFANSLNKEGAGLF